MKNLPLCTTCVCVYKEREEKGSEVILIDRACAYVMSGEYPADANKNERRSIRRKAKKFCITDGEVFYIRTNGSEVSLYEMT